MIRILSIALILASTPAIAQGFAAISDKDSFLQAVKDRSLNIGLFNLSIQVLPDGNITGTAAGWDLAGSWDWKDGLFCREMDWSGMEIPYNCQLVELNGNKMRFTSDGGTGTTATMTLR